MSDPNIMVTEEATVIETLSLLHPNAKKNSLRRMVDYGRVMVDGEKITKSNMKITKGAILTVLSRTDGNQKPGSKSSSLPEPVILYSDNFLIVADKPENLLSVATDRGELDTMYDRVSYWASKNKKTRIYLVAVSYTHLTLPTKA